MRHHILQPLLIPFTLLVYVAQIFLLPFYRPSSIRWHAGCLELIDSTPNSRTTTIWGRPGGQSWGIRVIWFNARWDRDSASLRVHERVHALHGEWVNAAAHVVFVPPSLLLGGWWIVGAIALSQCAFGISYGGHFLFEWIRGGFGHWYPAYMKIWSEKIAYRVDDEYDRGMRPGAWGGDS